MEKSNKSNDKQGNNGTYIPTYIPGEMAFLSYMQIYINDRKVSSIKPNTPDPTFKHIICAAQKTKRAVLMERRNKQMMESVYKSEPEESGSNEFNIPVYMGDLDDADVDDDDDDMCGIEDEEEPETDPIVRDTYHKTLEDMKKSEQDEKEMATEHLEVLKKVQAWYENLPPMLDDEEAKGTEFDIHEYGTWVLNRFSKVNEQKTFSELFGGMAKEEVARYFSSLSMLINSCNLKMLKSTNGEPAIELLKKERHHEELQVNVSNQVNKE